MKLCGLTGGVGMGKSTVAGFLMRHGARVIDTDNLARELVRTGQPALAEIQGEFGNGIVTVGGELNRAELARIVFSDSAARQKLEAILHPRIRAAWQAQVERWRAENCPLAVVVIPLLFETQAENQFTKILCAACTPVAQHERLRQRGWTPAQIQHRRAAQLPVAQKIARAHCVVWTEGSPEVLAEQCRRILSELTE